MWTKNHTTADPMGSVLGSLTRSASTLLSEQLCSATRDQSSGLGGGGSDSGIRLLPNYRLMHQSRIDGHGKHSVAKLYTAHYLTVCVVC
jgi:hypothetical protein